MNLKHTILNRPCECGEGAWDVVHADVRRVGMEYTIFDITLQCQDCESTATIPGAFTVNDEDQIAFLPI